MRDYLVSETFENSKGRVRHETPALAAYDLIDDAVNDELFPAGDVRAARRTSQPLGGEQRVPDGRGRACGGCTLL